MIEADCFTMSERYVVTFRNATSRPPMRVENFSNLKITFKQAGVSWSPQVCELRLCERCFCVRRFRDAFFRLFFFCFLRGITRITFLFVFSAVFAVAQPRHELCA